MPVFRSGKGNAPAWCELEDFEFLDIKFGETKVLRREAKVEEVIVCRGRARVACGRVSAEFTEGGKFDLHPQGPKEYSVTAVWGDALVFRALGRWKSVTSSGVFAANTGTPPTHDTPHDYLKTTTFDNHYHDCDECWVLFEGRARIASEGKFYDVGPGDCVATGMGWHHDMLSVEVPVRAVWFESGLEGEKRSGHLWEPKHGKAEPKRERV